jgi:hypothetical protein
MNLENTYIKPCPFCGSEVDGYKDSGDFIYPVPTASGARLYEINCLSIYGGCGASILGNSPEECIEKWNTRFDAPNFDFGDYDTIWDENDPY